MTPPASSSSSRSPTRAVSARPRATRESVASEPFPTTISRTFDDGFTRTTSPSILLLPLAALARATSKDLTKTIYLTFDDGPNPTWTPEILSLLQEYGAHASSFVVGESAKRWPGLVEQEARDGDTVGDHTWSHPALTTLSASAVFVELGRDRNLVTTLTGEAPTLWRPPYELSTQRWSGLHPGWG